ncbi:hypothetical protein [Embleya sp. AB8]|uniref:hypothetical protein n=1 Tax=Embleya sp. AB8 TaxID=3156304 RepID=UPI003C76FA8B
MESWPRWARVGVPVLALVLLCWLLIWLFSAFLMLIVKGVVGLAVVVGMIVLVRTAAGERGPREPLD